MNIKFGRAILVGLCFCFIACHKKTVVKIKIDVAYSLSSPVCTNSTFRDNIKKIYQPFEFADKQSIGVLYGDIFSVELNKGKSSVSIIDTSTNVFANWKKKYFGKNESLDASVKKYENIFMKVDFSKLCASSLNKNDTLSRFTANLDIIKKNYISIFVYSNDSHDSSRWNNYKVYTKIDDIRNAIYSSSITSKGPFLIILRPSGTPVPPPPCTNCPPTPSDSNQALTKLLNQLTPAATRDAAIRKQTIDTAFTNFFASDFVVRMHYNTPDANARGWEKKGDGRRYLVRLTTDESITGFKILRLDKSVIDNKIITIELVEYHKNF